MQMKGFGFRLGGALVCLLASIALAGNEDTTKDAGPKACGVLISDRAYGHAPIARITIDRALQNERLAPRIAQVLEAIVWLGDQQKSFWVKLASGLRNGVYNPVPTNSPLNNLPTYLRTEKGRAELLRVLEAHFTTPASIQTLELLAELLDRYPKVPYLPQHSQALSQLFTALTLSGAKSFHERHFNNYTHAFITFAAHHWVHFEGEARDIRDKDAVARRTVREKFVPAQYHLMLHTYMVKFLNFALNDIWAAVSAGTCDLLTLIDKRLGAFTRQELGNNLEKQNLLRAALIWSLIGAEVRDGQTLRKEILSTFNEHARELVEQALAELAVAPVAASTPTTPTTEINSAQITTVAAASEQPVVQQPKQPALAQPSAGTRRPVSSRRQKKRELATQQTVQNQTQATQNTKPAYPPLTDDMRAALLEGRANLQSDNNINFNYAVKITVRLLGPYRTTGSSHFVFHNPYSDRHVFNFQRHGNDLWPSNGRQLRHLIAQMIEIYEIDTE